jgi:hypothetical protein
MAGYLRHQAAHMALVSEDSALSGTMQFADWPKKDG